MLGIEAAEQQIGVGHGRLRAAAAIASRTRHRAGALRADAQRLAFGETRDAAAAGADLENIHHRNLDRQRPLVAADQRRAGGQRPALADDARLCRGAAHIESDRIRQAELMADRLRANDAGGRPGFQHAHAFAPRLIDRKKTAGRLHDIELAAEAIGAQLLIELAEIAIDARTDIGIGGDCRGALEFAIFLRQSMRGRDEDAGNLFAHQRLDPLLMRRIAIGMEQQDRDGFDAARFEIARDGPHLLLVERHMDRAIGQHPLLDLEAPGALHQRLVLAEEQIVGVGPVDAADLVDIAEALGDQQRRLRAGALEQRVDADGGAVKEEIRVFDIGLCAVERVADAFDQRVMGRQRLSEGELGAGLVERREIGESAADIDGDAQPARRSLISPRRLSARAKGNNPS